jgi:hypothetical protein
MPKGYLVSSVFSSTPPMQYKYFNFLSVISFNRKLIDEINSTISDLKNLISFICTNHESYALNCGKGYLPYNKKDGKYLNLRKPETENEEKVVKSIADKNLPKMYVPQLENIVNIKYTNPQIIQSLTSNTITNILVSP